MPKGKRGPRPPLEEQMPETMPELNGDTSEPLGDGSVIDAEIPPDHPLSGFQSPPDGPQAEATQAEAQPQPTDMVETKQDAQTRALPCKLTDSEMLSKGQIMADLLRQYQALMEEKKQVISHYGARLMEKKNALSEIQQVISSGREVRTVSCSLVFDYATNRVTVVRSDTGETIETRAMEVHERQKKLQFPDPPAQPEAEKDTEDDDTDTTGTAVPDVRSRVPF